MPHRQLCFRGATAGAAVNGALDVSSGGLEAVEATWRAREDAAGQARC